MSTRLDRFEMPQLVQKNEATATPTYAEFTAEPFESGYGRTIGNSLRRVLLSSMEGAAIGSVRIQGAEHEFCHLKGCVEDVTDIVLNLKKILFKLYVRTPKTFRIKVEGPGEVTAGDIRVDPSCEVLNPDQHICTLDTDGVFDAEVEVKIGRGYCPAVENKHENQEIGLIPIDSLFSPVRRVKYSVDNCRLGRRTDYEKLTLEIWTDGRISPADALSTSATLLRRHVEVFVNFDRNVVEFGGSDKVDDPEVLELVRKLSVSVNEIELSVRAANCLNNANITTVGELAQKTEAEMLKYRNFGKKSLNEIKHKLEEQGLSLGMTFEPAVLQLLGEKKD
jgi:DNA-directed RNA polymerase subunit alpha